MNNMILKFLQSCIIIISFANNSFAEEIIFYKDPTYENVKKIIDSFANNDDGSSQISDNLTQQLTMVFSFHPDLIKSVIPSFQNYSENIQKSIAQSIINTKGWSESLPAKYKSMVQKKLNTNINFLIYSGPEESNYNLMLTDFFIQAFYISGDTKYLEKILKFIANFPQDVKSVVHKIIFENISDQEADSLMVALNEHHANLAVQLKNVIRFLDPQRINLPHLDASIREVITTNKSYNYRNKP